MCQNFVCVSFVKRNRFVWSLLARKGVSAWSYGKVVFIQGVQVSTVSIKKIIIISICQISGCAVIFEWGRARNLPNHDITCSYFKISRVFVIVACIRSHVTKYIPVHSISITFFRGQWTQESNLLHLYPYHSTQDTECHWSLWCDKLHFHCSFSSQLYFCGLLATFGDFLQLTKNVYHLTSNRKRQQFSEATVCRSENPIDGKIVKISVLISIRR